MGTARNPDRATLGPAVGKLAGMLGRPFLPWQQHLANVALEVEADGTYHYRRVVVDVPRRGGKSTFTLIRQVHRAITQRGISLWYGAQSRKEGLDIWNQQIRELLAPHKDILGYRQRLSIGSEALRFPRTESELALFTPSDSALVGLATDDVTVDEARFHSPTRGLALEAGIRPTQATRNGQLWIVSSPGTFGISDWLYGWLQRGLAAIDDPTSRTACFSWSIPPDGDPTDLDLVAAHHPAVGLTITKEFLASELADLDPYDFAREYAGVWTRSVTELVPARDWTACADPSRAQPAKGDLAIAFATSPDRSTSSIGASWRDAAGVLHVALLDHRPGADWVIGRLLELRERWQPRAVAFNAIGPAVSIADVLQRQRAKLTPLGSGDYVVACGTIFEAVLARELVHGAQPDLDAAVAGVGSRTLGERWVWAYRASSATISPLEAVTLASWAYDHARKRRTGPVVLTG